MDPLGKLEFRFSIAFDGVDMPQVEGYGLAQM
jgi:hypothetical protein